MNDTESAYAMAATAPTHLEIDGKKTLLTLSQRTSWLETWGNAMLEDLMGEHEARAKADRVIIEARY